MYFIIILFVVVVTTIFAAFRIPNVASRIKSKLPRINASKWVKNPKLKKIFKDREFFKQNVAKISTAPLFIVVGIENYKVYDLLFKKDELESENNFKNSDEAFAVLTYQDATFLFIHPKLANPENKDDKINTRTRVLIERIVKCRRRNFIDGIIIMPHPESMKDAIAKTSQELTNDIKYTTMVFHTFSNMLKTRIPLYFFSYPAVSLASDKEPFFKNIFSHDPFNDNNSLYLGFTCQFYQKADDSKLYAFFQDAMTSFMTAFQKKTVKILNALSGHERGLFGVHTIYNVQQDDFRLSQNYISYFLNYFDGYKNVEFQTITLLNSVLFASFEGSTQKQSVQNMFSYLAVNGKDRMVFSTRFLNHKHFKNVLFIGWTAFFGVIGVLGSWQAHHYLFNKRMAYIADSMPVYQKFATLFNNVLSNRYPFANPDNNQNANFDNIVYVFNELQAILKSRNGYFFEHIDQLTQKKDAQIFIDQMKAVKTFLLSQTDQGPTASTFMIGARFEYRVNEQEEYLANRIVDWLLQVGDDKYGSEYGQPQKADFLWSYGNPLVFTVDFFDHSNKDYDSNLSPKKTLDNTKIQGNSHMYVQGESVLFSYIGDSWSLLRFIEEHDICPKLNIPCQKALLQFIIPLENRANAVFFCSLALQDINGNNFMMPLFPKIAPMFSMTALNHTENM